MIEPGSIILLSGVPGAGKTTVARLLAERFAKSVHIEGDAVGFGFIVSGLVPPQGPPQDEADSQMQLRRRNTVLLANSFADDGFTTVIDDVVVTPVLLEQYVRELGARPIAFVQLTPSLEVVRARDAGRHKQVFDLWSHLDAEMRAWPEPRPGLWLDTSTVTAEATADTIISRIAEAVVEGSTFR